MPSDPADLLHLLTNLSASMLLFDDASLLLRAATESAASLASLEPGVGVDEVAARWGDTSLPAAVRSRGGSVSDGMATVTLSDGVARIRRVSRFLEPGGRVGACVSYLPAAGEMDARRKAASQRAHDLRTPLGAILMWAKLLRSRQMSPTDIAAGLDAIIHSAEQQQQLIDQHLKEG